MRLFAPLLALLLLSGCWTGEVYYGAADMRPGIAAGRYRLVTQDGENKVVLVSPGPDGLTRFELIDRPGEPSSFAGFVPLDDSGETFIAWPEGRGGVGPSWRGYGLVRRAVGGGYIVLLPDCRRTAAIVAAAGGTVDPRGNDSGVCDLPDRASLEAAMRALATTPGDHGPVIRLEPLGA